MSATLPPDVESILDLFDLSLRSRNRSDTTRTGYLRAARALLHFCADAGVTSVADIRRPDVERYVTHHLDQNSAATAATYYRYVQQFFRFAVDEGELAMSPMAQMAVPTVPEKLVPVIPRDQLAKLVAAPHGKTFIDRRDAAILRLFASTGIRIAEMAGIAVNDVDVTGRLVGIGDAAKGSRPRQVSFGPNTALALGRFRRARDRHRLAHMDGRWLGLKGPLTTSGIAQMIERRAIQAGIDRVTAHQFRHTFAHEYLVAGGNEGDLQTLAGWRSPQMLARYGASARGERALNAQRRLAVGDDF